MRPGVSHVTALDYDRFCVDEVMPTVFEKFGAQREKIERAYGSYNHIPRKGFYDFIIAVGALHHSEDLNVSFKSLYDALKPGGILLVSDVCEPDSLTNAALTARYETVDPGSAERYGRLVKVQDNGDHWYRLSQWLSSAWASGFESLPFLFDHVAGMSVDDEIFRRPRPYLGFSPVSYQPYFAVNGQYDRLVLVLEKPDVDGSAPVTGKAAAWTVDEYAGAWASRHSLAAVTQRGRFSSLLAGLLGQN
jgi:SAM-dependent methyltransferase